ncbi:MAG: hypothetical protein CVU71_03600 [Deltaproteobacteria bacterium HGW-Deltaproteobacteria-6]|jgi:hypothetical protein|nr:MAG: hypothetical protein CVU71_03600 [Deltaproteobacteria bacterium HGW-Deltaproteobacteria-6]
MTPKRHDGDCNMLVETKQVDPPVRNSLFVAILLSIVGVLLVGFASVVYSQMKDQISIIKEQQLKNDAQEVRLVQVETALFYIKQSLDKIESNTKTTAEKIESLDRRIKK